MALISFRLKQIHARSLCGNNLLPLALVGILIVVAPVSVRAQVTYIYTGNSFTSVNGNIGATLSDHISIVFSVATALAPNLNCVTLQTGGTGSLVSFFMSDGTNNYGLAQNTTVQCISTSATGQITQWSIGDFTAGAFPYIVSTNIPSTGNVNDVSALTTVDFASVRNNPGTWTQGPPGQLIAGGSLGPDSVHGFYPVGFVGQQFGFPFQVAPGSAWTVQGLQVLAFYDAANPALKATFYIAADASGLPGQVLMSFNLTLAATSSSFPQIVTAQASSQVVLQPGTTYWLYGTTSTPAGDWPWLAATGDVPVTGALNNSNTGLGWRLQPGDFLPAFAIFGTPASSGCPVSAPTGSTLDFTDRAAFAAATSNLTKIGFAGILPPGEQFGGYSQLDVPGVTFSTPISGTFVNVTTAGYYSPNVYAADFIVDSVNQLTGQPNSNNTLCTSLTQPTFALGLDVGGLGFSGVGSGTITLSNGHVFSIQSLPTVGNTTFVGFISTQPITNLTFSTTNDSWVVEDLLIGNPIVPSCTFSLSPSGQAFGPQGGLGTFFVNTGAGCTWTPTFNDPWLTPFPFLIPHIAFPGGGPTFGTGPGPGKVSFNVAPNVGAARTGSISVGNQTFRVGQDSGTPVCTFSINPSHAVIDDLGGNLRVVVTAPGSCVWTATSNAGWLSVASGASGSGTGPVTIRVGANTDGARTGTLTIAGQTFTVSQGGGACGALDVTAETSVLHGGLSYIPFTTYLYSGTITVTNGSAVTLHPPLYVVLVGLPNHFGYPYGDGSFGALQTTCFTPAGDNMYLLPTGDLPPGRSISIAPLFFTQSLFGGISYQPRVLSGTPTH